MHNALPSDFYLHMEVAITRALANLDQEETRGFWCDGVMPVSPDHQYEAKFVNDNRTFELKAFAGKDGQSEYRLLVQLGPKAVSRYARGLDINTCIPDAAEADWFRIDTANQLIHIQLH